MIGLVRIVAVLKAVEPRHWLGLGASAALHLGVLLGWQPGSPPEPQPISFEIALEPPDAKAQPLAKTKPVVKKSTRKLAKQRKVKTRKLAAKEKSKPNVAKTDVVKPEPHLLAANWRGENKARLDVPSLALPDAHTLGLPAGIPAATQDGAPSSGKPKLARAEGATANALATTASASSAGLSEPGLAQASADAAPRGESGLALAQATALAANQGVNPGTGGAGAQASTAAASLAGSPDFAGERPGGLLASASPQAALNAPLGAGVQAATTSGSLAVAAGGEAQGVRLTASSSLAGLAAMPAGAGSIAAGPAAATLAQGTQAQTASASAAGGSGGGVLVSSQASAVGKSIHAGGRAGAAPAGLVEAGSSRGGRGQEAKAYLGVAKVVPTALIGASRNGAGPGRAGQAGAAVALAPGEPGSSPRFAVTLQPVLANVPASNPYLPARPGRTAAVASDEPNAGTSRATSDAGVRMGGAAAAAQRFSGVGSGASAASGQAPAGARGGAGVIAAPGQNASVAVLNAARDSGRAPVVLQATRVIPVQVVRPDSEIQRLDVLAPSNYCPLPLPGHDQPDNRAPLPDRNIAEQPAYALDNPRIDYPVLANIRGIEGRVTVRVEVLPTGRPGKMWLKQSSGSGILDQNAQEQLKQWRFVPARKHGLAVSAWIDVPVLYRLSEARP